MEKTKGKIDTSLVLIPNTQYYEIIDTYLKIPQPTTGIEVILTGHQKDIWLMIEDNSGISVKDFCQLYHEKNPETDIEDITDTIIYLGEITLISLKPDYDW